MAKVFYSRIPRNYDGTRPTTRRMTDLIPQVLSKIGEIHDQRHDLILACWPEVIGPQLAGMTQAFSFNDGILVVKVRNSTLHSLLNQHEKFRIILILRKKFPHVEIKTIHFR